MCAEPKDLEKRREKMNPPICDENYRLHVTKTCIGSWLNNQPVTTDSFIHRYIYKEYVWQTGVIRKDFDLHGPTLFDDKGMYRRKQIILPLDKAFRISLVNSSPGFSV
jgi:hypothetical protein